jgi:hypothetical protein
MQIIWTIVTLVGRLGALFFLGWLCAVSVGMAYLLWQTNFASLVWIAEPNFAIRWLEITLCIGGCCVGVAVATWILVRGVFR